MNDLDVAPNGDVYFTSSTERGVLYNAKKGFYDTLHSYLQNLCKGDNTGRLLKYDAATRKPVLYYLVCGTRTASR